MALGVLEVQLVGYFNADRAGGGKGPGGVSLLPGGRAYLRVLESGWRSPVGRIFRTYF